MKIEAGKKYKARNGEVYGPLVAVYSPFFEGEVYGFIDPNKRIDEEYRFDFYPDGRYFNDGIDSRADLIEEVNQASMPTISLSAASILFDTLEKIVEESLKPELTIHDAQKKRYSQWAIDMAMEGLMKFQKELQK